ncbi:MAG: hypothetical protein ACRCUT_14135, partial [Spirochaetota bacterium]
MTHRHPAKSAALSPDAEKILRSLRDKTSSDHADSHSIRGDIDLLEKLLADDESVIAALNGKIAALKNTPLYRAAIRLKKKAAHPILIHSWEAASAANLFQRKRPVSRYPMETISILKNIDVTVEKKD